MCSSGLLEVLEGLLGGFERFYFTADTAAFVPLLLGTFCGRSLGGSWSCLGGIIVKRRWSGLVFSFYGM